tara:strand:+ start:851 stop:1456 length:606 start_codon:yes stop_codon:yes gene_type:complete
VAIISDGTTIADAASFSVGLGNMVLLNTATASSSASLSFNNTYINSNYLVYQFICKNMNPANDGDNFSVNFSIDNGSNYNVAKTSTYFHARHGEDGNNDELAYQAAQDLAQGTGLQRLAEGVGGDSDQCTSGIITLFNPSSTTFIKHYISNFSNVRHVNQATNLFVGGYANTTSAVNAIQFSFNSDNINAGQIKLYGIKGS